MGIECRMKNEYPESINLDDLSYLNHDFVTVGCTDETYCTKCGEESHIVQANKIPCKESIDGIRTDFQ